MQRLLKFLNRLLPSPEALAEFLISSLLLALLCVLVFLIYLIRL